MIGKIYQNTPKRIRIPINTGPYDGTTVTSVILTVSKPSGVDQVWSNTIVSAEEGAIVIEHVAADGDLDEVGYYGYQVQAFIGGDLLDVSDLIENDLLVRRTI